MKQIIIYMFLLLLSIGCTKNFLDVNEDPNNPNSVPLNIALPAAEQGLAYALGFSNDNRGARGITEVLAVYTHQVTVREDQDQYGATGSEFNINGAWAGMYASETDQATQKDLLGCLQNLEIIINQATTEDNMMYAGIAKILKAYAISQFTDIFGDIPFSEANKFESEGIRYPKFDKGQDIYPAIFTLINEGLTDLNNGDATNALVPASDDLFYRGSKSAWIKFANTLKLKLYNQLRLVQDVTADVEALLANEATLFGKASDGFMMNYGSGSSPDDRNPGFSEYFATQKSHYQSPWFYAILKGYNTHIFESNPDPRLPYYFFNQLLPDGNAPNPTEYRDGAFVSILFGSVGPDRDHSQDASMTVFGIYPVGGRYDDGAGGAVSASSATGAAPLRLLTYADMLYIQAELMQAGVIAGDAKAALEMAIEASFNQVNMVVEKAQSSSQTVPLLDLTSARVTTYIDKVLAEYDAKNAAGKMEIIMTQKWIQSFGYSVDQYTDYRRTGYPTLFNPNNPTHAPGGFYQPPVNGNPAKPGAQLPVQVQLSRSYPLTLPWSQDELEINSNAPAQKAPATFRVFWDVD